MKDEFDIVFTSYGVLVWLPDLKRWAEILSYFLRTGGTFNMVEIHPILQVFDDSVDCNELKVIHPYSPANDEPLKFENPGLYADNSASLDNESYEWTHSLGEVISALAEAGLRIEFLHEFPVCCYKAPPPMEQDRDGWWHLEGDKLPLTFSIKATKPKS